jgi:hypothetical protein
MEDFNRSKDPRLGKGSLWAALPIPACRALTYAGQGAARDVLVALVLHSNDRSPRVFPSRQTIIKYSGVGKNNITKAIKVLEKFGFIITFKIKQGRTYRNEYEILRSAWHWDEFNEVASRYKVPKGLCLGCRQWLYGNEWFVHRSRVGLAEVTVRSHKNCGGRIRDLTKAQMLEVRRQEESAGII